MASNMRKIEYCPPSSKLGRGSQCAGLAGSRFWFVSARSCGIVGDGISRAAKAPLIEHVTHQKWQARVAGRSHHGILASGADGAGAFRRGLRAYG